MPSLAFVASGVIITGMVAAAPATASGTTAPPVRSTGAHAAPAAPGAKVPSRTQLADIRTRQAKLAVRYSAAPTFAKAGAKTFTVNTVEDSSLANPASTHCVDLASGKCSLRAAVEAANNLTVPVRIVLAKRTYTLSSATVLTVTNPHGVSVVGQGAGVTAIAGAGSNLFSVSATGSGVASGQLFLTSLKLKDGTAGSGGAVWLDDYSGSTLVLNHVVASNNTATDSGGAIFADDYNGVFINDSKFVNNHAPNGGALYLYWSDVRITGSSFTGNTTGSTTYGYGGAIYNYYGILNIKGGSISGNTAGDGVTYTGEGGGIYDDEGQVTLTKVHVDHNTATLAGTSGGYGGGLFTYFDAVEINGGSISHNHANGAGSGGGIYSEYGSQLGVHGVTMAGNTTDGTAEGAGGGAIFVYADYYATQIVVDGSKITGSNNSAVYLYNYYGGLDASIVNTTIANNHSSSTNGLGGSYGCGAGVCAYSYYGGLNLEMQGDHVTGNLSTADYGTGGVGAYGYEYAGVTLQLRKNVFADNHSRNNGYGGALALWGNYSSYAPVTARMTSNKFVSNSAGTNAAAGYGGAVLVYNYSSIIDHGSTFAKNRAVGDGAEGGAIANWGYQATTMTRSVFTGNSAGMGTTGNDGYGGAFYSTDEYGGSVFHQVTMAGNKAASYGGGFYGDSSTYEVSFDASTLSGNTAGNGGPTGTPGYGGGIYADDAVLTLQNSTLTGNRAFSAAGTHGQGGAVYAGGSRFDILYSTVTGNFAAEGAGVYANAYGGSLLSSILSRNLTAPHGSEKDCTAAGDDAALNSLGGNVLGQASCVKSRQGSDKVSRTLHLGALKNNGGPTKTMALSPKSPAVGRASFQVPSTDQRGHGRPGKHADAGAFELPKV